MTAGSFAGTGQLVRLALRRDRVLLPVWILLYAGMAALSAAGTVGLLPTVASRVQAAAAINDIPYFVALYGPVYDPSSLGALALTKAGAAGGALVGVLAAFLVVRHTRGEEEAGRSELLGGGAVGRYAALAAAAAVSVGGCLLLGVLTCLGLVAVGLPVAGSVAFGLGWAGIGVAFAGIAAITAQLSASAATARGLALSVLAVTYVLRALGDTAREGSWVAALRWLSPIGWAQQVRPYAGERWWPLLLPAGCAVLAAAVAYALASRRDLGTGIVTARPGRATASAALRGPFTLAWRLQRTAFLWWLAAFAAIGAIYGVFTSSIGSMLDTPQAKAVFTTLGGQKAMTDAFLAVAFGFCGIAAAAYGVQAALRPRTEESTMRAELPLAAPVSRTRWVAGHLAFAVGGPVALLAAAGLAAGVAAAARDADAERIWPMVGAAVVQLPAVWFVVGVAVLVVGAVPRWIAASWVALVGFVLLSEIGPLLRLDQWLLDLSPFTHIPRLPGADLTIAPLVWLTVLAAVLLTAGLAALRRREIR
ncbi:ABC transporter permease [Fodinicola acaciae]|uniref:ABC transporter permease n=1 Tax=Fodinicola acaciae TaxID=2681555 RepID=UPI0013D16495|nr:ABC transporter permease [Fodinicola acaciae]